MASDHDDPEVVIKAEKSSDELREERRQAAERDGDVLDVSSDSDEAAPPMKRVKTEPKAEKVALSTHGSFDPPTLAHVEMAKAVKAHLEASGEFEVKEFVFATTKNSYVLRKNKSYLDGRDRELYRFGMLELTEDTQEAHNAWREKRKPEFKGE